MCFWLFSADPPLPQSISMRDAWIPCPLITAHIHQGGYTWSLIIYFGLPKVNPSFRKLQVCDKKTWISLLPFNSSHRFILQSNITVVVSLTYFCSHCVPFCIIFCNCIYIQRAPLQFGIDLVPWSHFLAADHLIALQAPAIQLWSPTNLLHEVELKDYLGPV